MKLSTVKSICFGLLGVFCLLMLLLLLIPEPALGYAAVGIVVFIGIFLLAFWRCPHCGRCLGQMELSKKAKYCRYCGKEIDL